MRRAAAGGEARHASETEEHKLGVQVSSTLEQASARALKKNVSVTAFFSLSNRKRETADSSEISSRLTIMSPSSFTHANPGWSGNGKAVSVG
jgi:hypothetical protein